MPLSRTPFIFRFLLSLDTTDAELEVALARAHRDLARVDSELKLKQLQRLEQLNDRKSLADAPQRVASGQEHHFPQNGP